MTDMSKLVNKAISTNMEVESKLVKKYPDFQFQYDDNTDTILVIGRVGGIHGEKSALTSVSYLFQDLPEYKELETRLYDTRAAMAEQERHIEILQSQVDILKETIGEQLTKNAAE